MSKRYGCDVLVTTIGESRVQRDTADDLAAILNRLGIDAFTSHGGYNWKSIFGGSIARLKPRCVVAVNFVRPHFGSIFMDVPVFCTWLQDSTSAMSIPNLATHWNNHCQNDWVFGYTASARDAGFSPDRLVDTPFIIDSEKFTGVVEPKAQLFAAMSKGDPAMDYLRKAWQAIPALLQPPMTEALWAELVAQLYALCSTGGRLICYEELDKFVLGLGAPLASAWPALMTDQRIKVMAYWHVYERIYRQTVISWAQDSALPVRIAGDGWSENPRFAESAIGMLERKQLADMYASSTWSLHVNSHVGYHHRYLEVLLSGGRLLVHGEPGPSKPFNRGEFVALQDLLVTDLFVAFLRGRRPRVLDCGAKLYDVLDCCTRFRTRDELIRLVAG